MGLRTAMTAATALACLAVASAAEPVASYPDVDAWRAHGDETTADRLQVGHARRAAGDFPGAIAAYAALVRDNEAPLHRRASAAIYVGETQALGGDLAAARETFSAIASHPEAGAHFAWLAEQRLEDIARIEAGLPVWALDRTRTPEVVLPEPAATFHVAPDGRDDNPGTEEAPFATLERARDAMRAARAQMDGLGGATTYIRGGVYRVEQTFLLDAADSGAPGAPTVFRAYPGETPRFTGGVALEDFEPVADAGVLARLPQEARAHVVSLDLGRLGLGDLPELTQRGMGMAGKPLLELYCNGEPMRVARWPNEGFVYTGAVVDQEDSAAGHAFAYEGDRPSRWAQAEDIWLFGYWYHHWADCTLDVAEIDTERRVIRTGLRSPYDLREGQHYFVFNLLEEIDAPGEWYLDRRTQMLYVYPPAPLESATIELTRLAEPFIEMRDAEHVVLAGLTLDVGADAGVVIRDGASCMLLGCTLSRLGNDAVMVRGGVDHRVMGCDLFTLARGGVSADCGDRATLTSGGLVVENNHVHDFSRIDRAYTPAVWLDGVGARIAHNRFHDSPHQAMRIEGNDHSIVFNEVFRVVYESDDQAGLDMWGDPSYRGNEISYNFWHHIASPLERHGQAGIRLDDAICGVRMYGNVFYRSAGGIFGAIQIHGGKENVIDNNLFIDCASAISYSPWGPDRWKESLGSEHYQQRIAGRVDITAPPYSERYPELARLTENADQNVILRNLAVGCEAFAIRDSGANLYADNVQLAADPGFRDAGSMDLRLEEDNPVFSLGGFRPIPFELMGLYADVWRASAPDDLDAASAP